jgi:hypothetical protein
MQEPIRYYITKSGEEPTVRSVKVAQRPPEHDDNGDTSAEAAAEPTAPIPTPARTVERLVKSAMRGRSSSA